MNASPPSDDQDFPYWLVAMIALGLAAALFIANSDLYRQITTTVSRGLIITVSVTLFAFVAASLMGLLIALAALSKRLWLRQTSRFYVELVRGIQQVQPGDMIETRVHDGTIQSEVRSIAATENRVSQEWHPSRSTNDSDATT